MKIWSKTSDGLPFFMSLVEDLSNEVPWTLFPDLEECHEFQKGAVEFKYGAYDPILDWALLFNGVLESSSLYFGQVYMIFQGRAFVL